MLVTEDDLVCRWGIDDMNGGLRAFPRRVPPHEEAGLCARDTVEDTGLQFRARARRRSGAEPESGCDQQSSEQHAMVHLPRPRKKCSVCENLFLRNSFRVSPRNSQPSRNKRVAAYPPQSPHSHRLRSPPPLEMRRHHSHNPLPSARNLDTPRRVRSSEIAARATFLLRQPCGASHIRLR